MYEAKTKPTSVSAASYIAAIDDNERRKDCKALVTMMKRITGCPPKMWGPSIVGFDHVHYKYASGHEGDCCLVGFSSGKAHISLYLLSGYEEPATKALLAALGKHKTGKACLYIKRLSEVQLPVLEQLIRRSIVEVRKRHA
jgi:Domain of unknown function (DU1801)